MAASGEGDRRRLTRKRGHLLPKTTSAFRTCGSLDLRERHRRHVRGAPSVRRKDRRTTGEKAVGTAAVHRRGSGWKPLLLSLRLSLVTAILHQRYLFCLALFALNL